LLKTYEAEVASVDADYRKILQDDLPAFNRALESANLVPLARPAS